MVDPDPVVGFAEDPVVSDHIQAELIRLFGFGPKTAAMLLLAFSTFGSMLGSWLCAVVMRASDRYWYGGWQIKVSGGNSGRAWHMPLDIEVVKALETDKYVAFKRDLGTILSGEGHLDFSLGVDQTQPLCLAPPIAKGLEIDRVKRVITMTFPPKPPAAS